MFNLSEIMQAAQGGQAVNNLASQFGLQPEQAQQAISGLLPAFSVALQSHAQNMGSFSQIIANMMSGQHPAFDDPNAHLNQATTTAGNTVLSQLFGQGQTVSAIVQQVSQSTGIPTGTLMAMMPIIASFLMSGLFKSASSQGLGGLLGQIAGAFGGGGAGVGGAAGTQAPGQAGGGVLGSILGGMMGGMGGGAQPQPAGAGPQAAQPSGVPGMNPAMQAGMNILTGMFQSGAQAQGAHASILQDIFSAYMKGAGR